MSSRARAQTAAPSTDTPAAERAPKRPTGLGALTRPAGGNAMAQEALAAAQKGGQVGGYKGDWGAFVRRMERSYQTSFADVKLIPGEAGVAAGAVATTKGSEVHVGDTFGELEEGKQDEVLAHELAHVVQAKGGEGDPTAEAPPPSGEGGGGGDPEADAHQSAARALAGGVAAPTETVAPGSANNFGLSDIGGAIVGGATAVGGAVVDGASYVGGAIASGVMAVVDWGLDQINSAADLATYIAAVGEGAARRIIDLLAQHKLEILITFLTANPASGLLVYILRKLPANRIASWIASIDLNTLAAVVRKVAAAGALLVIVTGLMALGASLGPLFKILGGPTLTLLWSAAPAEMKAWMRNFLVQNWPEGLGLELDGAIGATFGYPVYLGAEAFFSVAHVPQGTFKLRRGGVMRVAADTGVGAGGFVGIGGGGGGGGRGQGGGTQGQGGGLGIGAEAGAQAQAGVKMTVIQEFAFPIVDDATFLSFVLTVMQADTSGSMALLGMFTPELQRVNPQSYNTSNKFEVKGYAEGNAAASAGLRTGGPNTQEGGGTWTTQTGARDTGSANWWQRWMSVGIFARLTADAGVGIEQQNKAFGQDAQGQRVPTQMEVSVYGEGSAAASIVHKIPVLSAALPQLPAFDGGVGIRVKWNLSGTPTATEPTISEPTWQVYAKTGEMDRYQGAASETAIGIGNLSSATFATVEGFLSSIQGSTDFKRRFSLGGALGRKYINAANRQGAFSAMLPAEYRSYGFRIEGYLDLESSISADQVRSIFREIIALSDAYTNGGAALQQLYTEVTTFLATGRAPAHVSRHLTNIANTLLGGISKLWVHGLVGLSVAAGGQISAGAKARLHGRVGAQLTMDQDIKAQAGSDITVDDIKQLLRGAADAAASALDVAGSSTPTGGN
jgi:hypothetical protein